MRFQYNFILQKKGEVELNFYHVCCNHSKLEDLVLVIEQQQKLGNIPYGYNLISINLAVINH